MAQGNVIVTHAVLFAPDFGVSLANVEGNLMNAWIGDSAAKQLSLISSSSFRNQT